MKMKRIKGSKSDRARIMPRSAGEDEVSDRVSELPDSVIHHIFDLMRCSKSVARTQLISKNWKRLFDSYPTFDFDRNWFRRRWTWTERRARKELETFKEYVERSLATRLDRLDCAEKFRLCTRPDSDLQLTAGWIRAAIAKNVKELDVNVEMWVYWQGNYSKDAMAPVDLTQSSSLTSLKINGDPLRGLAAMKMCNLRAISIEYVMLFDMDMMRRIEENCPLLEDLRLVRCGRLSNLLISSLKKLKTVEVQSYYPVDLIEIAAPNLETFSSRQSCRLDLKRSENLKNLTLKENHRMSDSELQDCISMFPLLEKLELEQCTGIEKPKISSLTLKSLALVQCLNLHQVEVDAPYLCSFQYEGRVMPFPFVNAPNLSEVKISFDRYYWRSNVTFENSFWNFDGSELLKLIIYTKQSMKIYENPRKADLSQTYDCTIELTKSSSKVVKVFEDWSRESHGESLVVESSNVELLKPIKALIMEREKSPRCCKFDSDKCWRHYIEGVGIATSDAAKKTCYELRWRPNDTNLSKPGGGLIRQRPKRDRQPPNRLTYD